MIRKSLHWLCCYQKGRVGIVVVLSALVACSPAEPKREASTEESSATAIEPAPAMFATELADAIRAGSITAEEAVAAYLSRIEALDRQGPMLQSVIALNPDALAQARALDAETRAGKHRGYLHGVPVLIKDNVETRELPTTAGSLALRDNQTGRDAPVVARLRAQGAIILGKTNLSEWANFRSNDAIAGWSGVGGLTRNPHSLDRTTCGSSSGSAVAIAAQLAPLAIGTETSGSIICPAAVNGVVGFKPTVGLLSRTHIVPISLRQDTAGPMARTVRDVATMLTVMAGTDADDPATSEADLRKQDYAAGLDLGVAGMRIGVFRWAEGDNPHVSSVFDAALLVLRDQGAVLINIDDFSPAPVLWESGDSVLRTEFEHALNAYLASAAPTVSVRTLGQLIAFNEQHADREMALFDQSILVETNGAGGVDQPEHLKTVEAMQRATREEGIDALLKAHDVEVLLMPSSPPAFVIDVVYPDNNPGGLIGAGWLAAMAGYPILTVPMGTHRGAPLGLSVMGTAWDDATVLAVGYAYEQASRQITLPAFARGPFDVPSTAAALRPDSPR